MTEEVRELSPIQELAEARSLRIKMKRLMDSEDYRTLCAHMQAKLDNTVLSVFASPNGVDSELINLHQRGKVCGFQEAMSFAQLLLNGAEGTIQQLEHLSENVEEEDYR